MVVQRLLTTARQIAVDHQKMRYSRNRPKGDLSLKIFCARKRSLISNIHGGYGTLRSIERA